MKLKEFDSSSGRGLAGVMLLSFGKFLGFYFVTFVGTGVFATAAYATFDQVSGFDLFGSPYIPISVLLRYFKSGPLLSFEFCDN